MNKIKDILSNPLITIKGYTFHLSFFLLLVLIIVLVRFYIKMKKKSKLNKALKKEQKASRSRLSQEDTGVELTERGIRPTRPQRRIAPIATEGTSDNYENDVPRGPRPAVDYQMESPIQDRGPRPARNYQDEASAQNRGPRPVINHQEELLSQNQGPRPVEDNRFDQDRGPRPIERTVDQESIQEGYIRDVGPRLREAPITQEPPIQRDVYQEPPTRQNQELDRVQYEEDIQPVLREGPRVREDIIEKPVVQDPVVEEVYTAPVIEEAVSEIEKPAVDVPVREELYEDRINRVAHIPVTHRDEVEKPSESLDVTTEINKEDPEAHLTPRDVDALGSYFFSKRDQIYIAPNKITETQRYYIDVIIKNKLKDPAVSGLFKESLISLKEHVDYNSFWRSEAVDESNRLNLLTLNTIIGDEISRIISNKDFSQDKKDKLLNLLHLMDAANDGFADKTKRGWFMNPDVQVVDTFKNLDPIEAKHAYVMMATLKRTLEENINTDHSGLEDDNVVPIDLIHTDVSEFQRTLKLLGEVGQVYGLSNALEEHPIQIALMTLAYSVQKTVMKLEDNNASGKLPKADIDTVRLMAVIIDGAPYQAILADIAAEL